MRKKYLMSLLACLILVSTGQPADAIVYGTASSLASSTSLKSSAQVPVAAAVQVQIPVVVAPKRTLQPTVIVAQPQIQAHPPFPKVKPTETAVKLDVLQTPHSNYPWKKNIITTTFWIGQGCSTYDDTTNYKSAWDSSWTHNYGGMDDPSRRLGFLPQRFAATLNPFYIALPFNDVKCPDLAKKYVPWWKNLSKNSRYVSQCKGRWVEIRKGAAVCFAQWEDVGPFRYDHAGYVFGNERPHTFSNAGLDVSPAIQTYLGLSGKDVTTWRFVEACEVTAGPWLKYGEQAIIFTALKQQATRVH
jgi:hypothetical protein